MSKKILAVALAAAMILGLASVAFAASFSDTVDHEREIAVKQLAGLGLLNGYEDGTFRPDNPITRAEFAKVMVYALGLKDAAEMLAGVPVPFTDVEANHWATGYISIATSQEIVKGYPDGTFGPQNNVTYAEVLTMILRALGYGPILDKGPWPTAYITKAADLKLNKGISFLSNAPATRGDVAGLVANAVSTPKLVAIAWGPDGTPTQYGVSGSAPGTKLVTLLHDMGAEYVEGWLIDSPELFTNTSGEIKLADPLDTEAEDLTLALVEGTAYEGLIGHNVRAWLNNEEAVFLEDLTPADSIKTGKIKSGKLQVSSKDVFKDDPGEGVVFRNYLPAELSDLTADDTIKVIYKGSTPVYVFATEYEWGVVSDVSLTYERVTFSTKSDRLSLRIKDVEVAWSGAALALDELEKNDVIDYIFNSDLGRAVFVVTRNVVLGEFEKKVSSTATVDGVDYSSKIALDEALLGYDVEILLNKDGSIVKMTEVDEIDIPSTVAVITAISDQIFRWMGNAVYKIRLFCSDGTTEVFELASKVTLKIGDSENDYEDGKAKDIEDLAGLLAEGGVISFETNSSGKIDWIELEFTLGDEIELDIEEKLSTVEKKRVTSKTLVFNLVTEGSDFSKAQVLTTSALLGLDDTNLWGTVIPDGAYAAIVVTLNAKTAASDTMYGMVYGSYRTRIDGNLTWIIRVLVDGKISDYEADADIAKTTVIGFKVTDGELEDVGLDDLIERYTSTSNDVYKVRVADVDLANEVLTIETRVNNDGVADDDSLTRHLWVDDETLFYDVTGSNPKSLTFDDIGNDAWVDVYADKDGVIKVLVVKGY